MLKRPFKPQDYPIQDACSTDGISTKKNQKSMSLEAPATNTADSGVRKIPKILLQ